MVGHALVLGLLAQAPAAPPPRAVGVPTAAAPATDPSDAATYAANVVALARRVRDEFVGEVGLPDLAAAAVSGLYRAAGVPVPAAVQESLARPQTEAAYRELLTQARLSLGDRPSLAGQRAFVASVTALSRAADPHCGLAPERRGGVVSPDPEFGLGFELAGATGPEWMQYYLDLQEAGTAPHPPVPVPWQVKRVIPGSPAAAAGLRAGDVIAAFRGRPVTAETSRELMHELLILAELDRATRDHAPGREPPKVALRVERPGEPGPLPLTLTAAPYEPESVFGFARTADGGWNLFPNPDTKIGYIRLGPLESRAAEAFHALLGQLEYERAAGLVLDLRWNPGGYVAPAQQITGEFLKPDQVIAKVKYRRPDRQQERDPYPPPAAGREWALAVPLVVLVNAETTGGGEMIAAALQDHKRAITVGQRTAGRAAVMSAYSSGVRGLSYRLTTGYTYRPNGKPRHRLPDSRPGDEWGVRPDPGYEVPTTPSYSQRLKQWADWQACRPVGNRTVLPLDDPMNDPQREIAEKVLLNAIRSAKK